mgnify:CR=1 FL=1
MRRMEKEEGEEGLRACLEEMGIDSRDTRARLKRYGLMLKPDYNPDAELERVFGIRLAG